MRKSEKNANSVHFERFDWHNNPTRGSLQAYVSLRRDDAAASYTSNMAAESIVDRMTSPSSHV